MQIIFTVDKNNIMTLKNVFDLKPDLYLFNSKEQLSLEQYLYIINKFAGEKLLTEHYADFVVDNWQSEHNLDIIYNAELYNCEIINKKIENILIK